MSKDHKKYVLREKMEADCLQVKFDVAGNIKKPVKTVNDKKVGCDDVVYCPFCLFKGKLQSFLISTGSGISLHRAECPDCGNSMLMKTVKAMSRMTNNKIVHYAKWCFMYRRSGFWKKVKRDIWLKRLNDYGWNISFWSTYRKLKASVKHEEYDYDEE